ncbi:phosphoribosyltransferase [Candidatus Bathyarchaeota archaeon]|nr:MAG: phosphoribosyltransferase [Candidatus Bathyarchaeota archaeon]
MKIEQFMQMKFLHTTWDDIVKLCEKLATKIVESGYKPDLIVAISRGGFAPARILCDILDIYTLASLSIKYYAGVAERRDKPIVECPLNVDVKGKKVLLVDDVADTGHSLKVAVEHIRECGASDVKVATLHYKPWSVFKPDFYGQETDAWVVYVWEIWETIRNLAEKLRSEGLSEEAIKNALISASFREEDVRKVLG